LGEGGKHWRERSPLRGTNKGGLGGWIKPRPKNFIASFFSTYRSILSYFDEEYERLADPVAFLNFWRSGAFSRKEKEAAQVAFDGICNRLTDGGAVVLAATRKFLELAHERAFELPDGKDAVIEYPSIR